MIYRKYRDGELPDIMIKLADVLRPLQHLSMLDGGIAREVFVQVFKASFPILPAPGVSYSRVAIRILQWQCLANRSFFLVRDTWALF